MEPGLIAIREAADAETVDTVRQLFREYQASMEVDLCFQNFTDELRALPGDYAPPRGRLLIAESAGEPAGCVALRPLPDGESCEMKRLFVRPQHRALGLGRQLTERVIAEARGLGYRYIYLDTLPIMADAQRLYERLGFVDVAPYRNNPVAGSRFMRLSL